MKLLSLNVMEVLLVTSVTQTLLFHLETEVVTVTGNIFSMSSNL